MEKNSTSFSSFRFSSTDLICVSNDAGKKNLNNKLYINILAMAKVTTEQDTNCICTCNLAGQSTLA